MIIKDVIQSIKDYHKGILEDGSLIDDKTSRDQILYGNPDQVCTGIITTCFASVEVINDAIEKGANLIICHEALFWNRGDRTDWLIDNQTFKDKTSLLDKGNIVVWRNHDYIHTGIPMNGDYVDGIFYGVAKKLDWLQYVDKTSSSLLSFNLPSLSTQIVAQHLIKCLNLNGLRLVGDSNTIINKIEIPYHIMGPDNATIENIENNNVDAIIALELIDYTVSEYIRDAAQLGKPKVIFSVGHFNLEEPGMEYMLEYLPKIVNHNIPVYFKQSGDTFEYVVYNSKFKE